MKEKYGFDDKNLRKNNCILEQVMLIKLEKRLKNREKAKQLKKPIEEVANNDFFGKDNLPKISDWFFYIFYVKTWSIYCLF